MTAEQATGPEEPLIRDPDLEPPHSDPEPAPAPARDPDLPRPPLREPPPEPPEPGEPIPTIEDPKAPGEAPAPMQVLHVSL